jgi:ArsR family transcriptional regulator, arsenate/arsenite/antimonite-responsive transcriptional repressor
LVDSGDFLYIKYAYMRIYRDRCIKDMKTLVKTMKALSDETRLRIIMLLLDRECCVCEVMQALGISETRASRNLSILSNVGLVQFRKEGLWSLYSIDQAQMRPDMFGLLQTVRQSLVRDVTAARDSEALKEAARTSPRNRCCVSG